jgi:hypothetical protein
MLLLLLAADKLKVCCLACRSTHIDDQVVVDKLHAFQKPRLAIQTDKPTQKPKQATITKFCRVHVVYVLITVMMHEQACQVPSTYTRVGKALPTMCCFT